LNCGAHDSDNADTTCQAMGVSVCDYLFRCSPVFALWKSKDDCIAVEKASCLNELSLKGGGMTVGVAWAETEIFSSTSCVIKTFTVDASCAPAGTLDAGTACVENSECKASSWCKKTHSTDYCGVCTAIPAVGTKCTSSSDCGAGSNSSLTCSNGACAKPSATGGSCSWDGDCVSTDYCSGSKCLTHTSLGGTCAKTNECVSGLTCQNKVCSEFTAVPEGGACDSQTMCAWGLSCQNTKCAKIVPGGECGMITTDAGASYIICGPGQYCQVATGSYSGTCADTVALGGTCDAAKANCDMGLTCISGKCGFVTDAVCK
jgi:hypothetical protein